MQRSPRSSPRLAGLLICLLALLFVRPAQAFDQQHTAWDGLLAKHVRLISAGDASRVDYRGMLADRAILMDYLAGLSAVKPAEFAGFTQPQKLAFLINAYNAFTVELILSRYPNFTSIKDLGSLFTSPWKVKFFVLLGQKHALDDIERDMIRAPGAFDDPRIHFALNCASIGCPMLRNEAYVGDRLDAQLDNAAGRFLGDRERNRYDPQTGTLEVSKIFDWYGGDFERGYRGITSVRSFLAAHAALLTGDSAARRRIEAQEVPIRYLDYDWRLNDAAAGR